MYLFNVFNNAENELWQLPYERLDLTEEINKGIDGSLSISYEAIKKYAAKFNLSPDGIIAASLRKWKLYRDTDLFARGLLTHRTIEGGNTGASTIVVYFTDYLGALGARYTPFLDTYTATDSSDIAWSIIDDSQNDASGFGDLGITRGLNPTTVDRQRTFRHENIRDAIYGMSRDKVDNGFDFDIDNTLNFNVYYPQKGQARPEIVLSEFNIISWSLNRPLSSKIGNRVHVFGEGLGDDLVAVTRENTTPMATWGLQEKTLSEKTTSDTDELSDRGDKFLSKYQTPQETVSVTIRDVSPDLFSYNLGDTVTVKLASVNFEEQLRIIKRTVSINPSGQATVQLSFEEQ